MMSRRKSMRGIIALGLAPAIIRVAHLMKINASLALPTSQLYTLCKFKSSSMPGVALSMLRSVEDRSWLLVAKNVSIGPLEVHRTLLQPGEKYVLSTSAAVHQYRGSALRLI